MKAFVVNRHRDGRGVRGDLGLEGGEPGDLGRVRWPGEPLVELRTAAVRPEAQDPGVVVDDMGVPGAWSKNLVRPWVATMSPSMAIGS
jgi:hypothetical protein